MNKLSINGIMPEEKVSFTSKDLIKILWETNPLIFVETIKSIILEKSINNLELFSHDDKIALAQKSTNINILNKLYQIWDDEILKWLLLNPLVFNTHFLNSNDNNLYLVKYISSKNDIVNNIYNYLITMSDLINKYCDYTKINYLQIDKLSKIWKEWDIDNFEELKNFIHNETLPRLIHTIINCNYNSQLFYIFSTHPDIELRKIVFLNEKFQSNVDFVRAPIGYWLWLSKTQDPELNKLYNGLKNKKELERNIIIKNIVSHSKGLNR